jgi:hypothetical protein
MRILQGPAHSSPTRTSSVITVTVAALAVVCGAGIAAFAGWLPESESVAVSITSTPLIDVQLDAYIKRIEAMR